MSPAVRKVLACSSLDGDTDAGRVVDSLAPDVVIARLIKGDGVFNARKQPSNVLYNVPNL